MDPVKKERSLISLLFFILAMLILGSIDQNDQAKEEQTYCRMVREQHWPGYKHVYKDICKEYEHVKDPR